MCSAPWRDLFRGLRRLNGVCNLQATWFGIRDDAASFAFYGPYLAGDRCVIGFFRLLPHGLGGGGYRRDIQPATRGNPVGRRKSHAGDRQDVGEVMGCEGRWGRLPGPFIRRRIGDGIGDRDDSDRADRAGQGGSLAASAFPFRLEGRGGDEIRTSESRSMPKVGTTGLEAVRPRGETTSG